MPATETLASESSRTPSPRRRAARSPLRRRQPQQEQASRPHSQRPRPRSCPASPAPKACNTECQGEPPGTFSALGNGHDRSGAAGHTHSQAGRAGSTGAAGRRSQ
eukprot:1323904-Pyramimonas_sp.AAC.1